MEWSTVLTIGSVLLTLGLGLFSIYLAHDRDLTKTKEHVARMIGDALAQAVAFAKGNMGTVTDEQLDGFSGGVYDFCVPKLPDGLPGFVEKYYPKPVFQALFRRVWREYGARNAALKLSVARQ